MNTNPGSVLGLVNIVALLSAMLAAIVVWFKLRRSRIERISANRQELLLSSWKTRSPDRIREVLGAISWRSMHALSDLIAALKSSDDEVVWDRELTEMVTAACTDAGVHRRMQKFLHSRSTTRRGLAVMLGGFAPTSLPPSELGRYLSDPDSTIGLAASASLGRIATPDAAMQLIAGLEHGDLPAPRLVERLGYPWAVETILARLASLGPGSSLHAQLLRALALSGDPRGIPVALRALAEAGREERVQALRLLLTCVGEADARERQAIAQAAAQSLASDDPTARSFAAQLAAEVEFPQRETLLAECARDSDWFVRRSAARALVRCGSPGVRTLQELAEGADEFAAQRAQEELRRMQLISTRGT